jgi:SAM-dependent methyltransferase
LTPFILPGRIVRNAQAFDPSDARYGPATSERWALSWREMTVRRMDAANKAVFEKPEICSDYAVQDALQAPERVIVQFLSSHLKQTDKILDIGVGTGRTTPHLMQLTGNYCGIDYSEQMIRIATRRHPQADLRIGDARELSQFGSGAFAVVFFAFNGIDCVSHESRLKVLAEILRVLKQGGFFVFSSHNRNYKAFNKLRIGYEGKVWPSLKNAFLSVVNRLSRLPRHEHTAEYSIITDPAHQYSLLNYYISAQKQIEQLRRAGFSQDVRFYDLEGAQRESPKSAWLYYVARKPG